MQIFFCGLKKCAAAAIFLMRALHIPRRILSYRADFPIITKKACRGLFYSVTQLIKKGSGRLFYQP